MQIIYGHIERGCYFVSSSSAAAVIMQDDTSSSGHPLKYVSHKFSGGAKCVLTGQPRTAEVLLVEASAVLLLWSPL